MEKKNNFVCCYCQNDYQTKRGLNKHIKHCLAREKNLEKQLLEKEYEKRLLEKDLEKTRLLNEQKLAHKESIIREKEKTIEIAKNSKQIINNHTTHNKTINYLNSHYGDMISMEKFLYNLENTEQLTHHERDLLLMAFKENGIELFARSFSQIMKENCKRQLLKEGLPEMNLIPLYCSDGNLRSHKEKGQQGWNTCYDDQSLNKMINISSDQVYESYQKSLMIFGKERNKVFKQIKQDNLNVIPISITKNVGIDQLINEIEEQIKNYFPKISQTIPTHTRYKISVSKIIESLNRAKKIDLLNNTELVVEELRSGIYEIGRSVSYTHLTLPTKRIV